MENGPGRDLLQVARSRRELVTVTTRECDVCVTDARWDDDPDHLDRILGSDDQLGLHTLHDATLDVEDSYLVILE